MPKKIILCFDGTCNDPNDARQKRSLKMKIKDSNLSNIFKLHLLLGGGAKKGEQAIKGQKSLYYSGVGTYGNKLLQWFNAALALPNLDVAKILNKAVDDLSKNYEDGDEVFVFGFSRGAALARRFSAIVNEKIDRETPISIRFLGVFDTVASIGWPNFDDDTKPISDVKFENCKVAECVEEALHMVSLDDKRTAFMPTLMAHEEKVTEIWFAGAHSDIGGGFRYDGLSDICLQFLLDEFTRRNLGLEFRAPLAINFDTDECRAIGLAYDDIAIHPNPLGRSHEQDKEDRSEWRTTDRDLRVHTEDNIPGGPELLPKIHFSVVKRIHGDSDYRPVSLSKRALGDQVETEIPHTVWRPDGEDPKSIAGLAEHLRNGPPAPRKLEVGESRLVTVYANLLFNRSYVYANSGEEYAFSVNLKQKWFDSGIVCGPHGWDRDSVDFPWFKELPIKYMEDERRCPPAKWFEIVGVVGKRQKPFQVLKYTGREKFFPIDGSSGELYFFANDLEERYDNNLGYIQVKVTRKK